MGEIVVGCRCLKRSLCKGVGRVVLRRPSLLEMFPFQRLWMTLKMVRTSLLYRITGKRGSQLAMIYVVMPIVIVVGCD